VAHLRLTVMDCLFWRQEAIVAVTARGGARVEAGGRVWGWARLWERPEALPFRKRWTMVEELVMVPGV
jgi:hypothetical protein